MNSFRHPKNRTALLPSDYLLLSQAFNHLHAEEQLSDMLDKAERLLRSLRDQPSTPFDPNSWPEGSAVAAALQECREAQRAFDQANAVLSPADRKLLKSVPADGRTCLRFQPG